MTDDDLDTARELAATPEPPIERLTAPDGRPVPCECCGRAIDPGAAVASWVDGERQVVAHWGPCVADDRVITIATAAGSRSVTARAIGLWAMHKREDVEDDGRHRLDFSVTHLPTGRRLMRAFTRREAWLLITRLGPSCSGPECVDLLPGSEAHETARQIILGVIAERSPAEVIGG